jgi:S-adenosylmethionine decarboxylase
MLKHAKCEILSQTSNQHFDAYVLSESSFFVWERKLVLKTCGNTTLLEALPMIFELAMSVGLPVVVDLFYSRRNWINPDLQHELHRDFTAEAAFLDNAVHGSSYVTGNVKAEHWNIYVTDSPTFLNPHHAEQKHVEPAKQYYTHEELSWELHMTKLNPEVMCKFHKTEFDSSSLSQDIASLIPGLTIDEFVFEPCGYSMNGLLEQYYVTIHVTPQTEFSYVSFETNVPPHSFEKLALNVLQLFQPSEFTLTATGISPSADRPIELPTLPRRFNRFARSSKFSAEFENEWLVSFAHYSAP